MTVDWDDPATTLFWIAFEADEWLVQGTGQLEDFFCLSFGHFLTPEQAIGEGGHPRPHPLGPVQPIIARSAPRVLERNQLVDRAADHPRNVFDVYLTGPRVTIKAGVRAESGVERSSSGASHHYA